MSPTWRGGDEPRPPRPGGRGLLRAAGRGLPAILLIAAGLALHLLLRAPERAVAGRRRPWTPWVTVAVCRGTLRLMGLRVHVRGAPMAGHGGFVANHASWLDILVLNAQAPMVFVAKSEVRGWPGIGWLARATGTVFVRREVRVEAAAQAAALARRLADGERLLLFPEGTSTDNRRVLPFRASLLSALLGPGLLLQPVTLRYRAPPAGDPGPLAWFGDAPLAPHVLAVLAAPGPLRATATFHPPIPTAGRDRKSLAAEAEAAVRSAL